MIKRKIAVVTGTRAEYGILKPLLKKIECSNDFELNLLVTGMHLLDDYGLTIKEIINNGFQEIPVEMYLENEVNEAGYHGRSLGTAIKNFTDVLIKVKPDLIILFGDRLEPLAAAMAAATLGIPIVHIHGGDKTDSGHIDESIRHSLSRFAHVHFTATKEHSERLVSMGEEPWRIYEVGALGLDSILNEEKISKANILKKLDLCNPDKIIVCIFHPVFVEKENSGNYIHEILEAVKEFNLQTVVIYPNNDEGSEDIIEEIERNRNEKNINIFSNLPHKDYINLLRNGDLLIGNSSSGIIEAPSLKLPVINVGSRNLGRDYAENVIFVDPVQGEIRKAIRKALFDKEFKDKVKSCINPYGDGQSSDKIMKILNEMKINKKLLQKKITF